MSKSGTVRKRAYATLLAFALLWTAGTVVSPLLLARHHYDGGVLARLVYMPVCHQQSARSFHIDGFPLAVCERCSAIYAAFTLGVFLYPLFARISHVDFRFAPFLLFLLPVVLDYVLDVLGVWQNSPLSRTLSGAVAGLGLAAFATPAWIEAWTQVFRRRETFQHEGRRHE